MDEIELERLDLNHEKYSIMYKRRLYLCPLEDDPQNILDIGCGSGMSLPGMEWKTPIDNLATGIWCIDMADNFPSAEVS
jgi:hypothetical protein